MDGTSNATLSRELRDSIARRISDFALKPGERLAEEGLARRYNVSRTPVREALKMLHEMGLVERVQGGGYAVRVVELDAISDLMVIWATLEDLAVKLASRHTDAATFERLLEQTRDDNSGDPVVAEKFHSELARLSGNSELIALLHTIYLRTQPYRRLDGLNRGAEVHADHVRILELLINGAVDEARALIRMHTEKTHQFIETLIKGGVRSLSFESST